MAENPNLKFAQEYQGKFELYLVSLSFTLLALSIQTAKLGTNTIVDIMEVVGWMLLLVSGLTGLSKIENVPVTIKLLDKGDRHQRELERMLSNRAMKGTAEVMDPISGERTPIEREIEKSKGLVERWRIDFKKKERIELAKYAVHRYSFMVGVVVVAFARSSPVWVHIPWLKSLLSVPG